MLKNRIIFAICGSFCTFKKTLEAIEALVQMGYDVQTVLSFSAATLDTRFMTAENFKKKLFDLTGKPPFETIQQAEPIGPHHMADALVIAPCTGNTLAKLAAGIIDTPVLMAAKSHLRNSGAVIIALSTNDGLSASAKNIGKLLNTKNIYFVPFAQDDYIQKPTSLQADFTLLEKTIKLAIENKQIQPILV
ncbi:MAG: dipicolinate synthase subunit B, partial [Oscillospiraceae bacterium]